MELNVIRLHKLCEDRGLLLTALRNWNLIPESGTYFCPKCGGVLLLCPDNTRPDGWYWKCNNLVSERRQKAVKCGTFVSFRTGTFFARSKLEIFQILAFVNLWVGNCTLQVIQQQLEISCPTTIDWASFCREVLVNAFITNKTKLGGPGKVVEIDESKFGRRKHHRGHHVDGQWVFGGYERGTGRVFMVSVEARGADTLLPIIQDWIEPGTTILSDYWKAYDCLDRHDYVHLKVNHSLHFKDPETDVHTNAIESSWRAAKAIISSSGRKKSHIPGNLARYMFYKRCGELKLDRTTEFFRLAGSLYNPCNPTELPAVEEQSSSSDDEDREAIDEQSIF